MSSPSPTDAEEQKEKPSDDSVANDNATLATKESVTAAQTKETTVVEEGGIIPPKPTQGDAWRVASSSDNNNKSKRRLLVGILVLLVIAAAVVVAVVVTQGDDDDDDDDDERSTPAASIVLFENPSTVTWQVQARINNPKIANSNIFAVELGMSADGTRLVVANKPVGAHVYHLNNGTWQIHSFLQDDNLAGFGAAVAMAPEGDEILVLGQDEDADDISNNIVYAYRYKAENDQWEKLDQVIEEFNDGDGIGWTTGFGPLGMGENGMLAVASPQHGGKQGRQGLIRFFERTQTGPWNLQGRVEGKEADDYVGHVMRFSADGSTVVSSFELKNTNERGFSSGIVWVWRRDQETDEWKPLGAPILGPRTGARLGYNFLAISRNGNTIVAGAYNPWGNNTAGVFVYDFVPAASSPEGDSWELRGGEALVALPGHFPQNGLCLSADGSVLVMASFYGASVLQYDAATQTWEQVGDIESDDESDFGPWVACTHDVRTIALGRTTSRPGEANGFEGFEGKVIIWTAVESSDNE